MSRKTEEEKRNFSLSLKYSKIVQEEEEEEKEKEEEEYSFVAWNRREGGREKGTRSFLLYERKPARAVVEDRK